MNKLVILISLTLTTTVFGQVKEKREPSDFLPKGYVIFEKFYCDLNKDEIVDCILIIKGTNKDNVVVNRFDKKVDRNRRGIIILLNKNDHYVLALKNYDCFTSENEDGGNYFPTELCIEFRRGNLIVHYDHGRYGFWRYIFRFQDYNFKLIGYDSSSNRGPIINKETSINFLTKKKLIKENTNKNAEGGDEVFKETWGNIKVNKLIKLSEIKDFGKLDMSVYLK